MVVTMSRVDPRSIQNMTMQKHQQCETLEEKEQRRWLARQEAALHATFPTELEINGITIPIFKVPELEQLGAKRLKERAMNLRDMVESTRSRFFESKPNLRLNIYGQPDAIVGWIVDVQVTLAAALGFDELDHAAFGQSSDARAALSPQRQPVPNDGYQRGPAMEPCWSQAGLETGKHALAASPPPQQQSFPWSQHGAVQEMAATNPRARAPQHDGFSLVPPHMEAGHGRGLDAANNRYRATASAVLLG